MCFHSLLSEVGMQAARLVGWQDVSSVYKLPTRVCVCVCVQL